jgi:Pyruvate/2-oxoacid:ferredoxin oxidoreductase delta subunit
MFAALFKPLKSVTESMAVAEGVPEAISDDEQVAIIQGRFCLAYQRSFCTTCSERCPEDGAIIVEQGVPRVVADKCTGCGICNEVCPAPKNAVLMMNKPTKK